jgi:hypothetical protein
MILASFSIIPHTCPSHQVLEHLHAEPGVPLRAAVRLVQLPKATFVRFRPLSAAFATDIADPAAVFVHLPPRLRTGVRC